MILVAFERKSQRNPLGKVGENVQLKRKRVYGI